MGDGPATGFLIDTSAAGRLPRLTGTGRWLEEVREGRVSICAPTQAEVLYSARSVGEFKEMARRVEALYTWRQVPDDAWPRARALQRRLMDLGCHRAAGVVDLLVAVTAQHHELTVLHYDRDVETLAEHAGLRARWLAEPGTID